MKINLIRSSLVASPRALKKLIAIIHDCIAIVFSVWFSFGLRLDEWGLVQVNQWVVCLVAGLIALPLFYLYGLYTAIFRYLGSAAIVSMVRLFSIYLSIFFLIFSVIGVNGVPRSIGIIQPLLLSVLIGFSRYQARLWLSGSSVIKKLLHADKKFVLIYGAGLAGRNIATFLKINPEYNLKGFVDDGESYRGCSIDGINVYESKDLYKLLNTFKISVVFLALPEINKSHKIDLLNRLQKHRVRVKILPDLGSLGGEPVFSHDLSNFDMDDLLGRESVLPNPELLSKNVKGKDILITGAGGSIGSELCRQIIRQAPRALILIDHSEFSLYKIYQEVVSFQNNPHNSSDYPKSSTVSTKIYPILASVLDRHTIFKIFHRFKPDAVFHAAAFKHVPLVELNQEVGIRNNIWGTLNCAQASLDVKTTSFILVSTDKAVRPTNVMGASKRISEMVLQALAQESKIKNWKIKFSMVRFGNVLGSSGSVVPLFFDQIKRGGPVTLTHPEVTRFFMTIPEAAQLVIQASAMSEGGDVFILDMGKPVRIYDLATRMILLSGFILKDEMNPDGDIEIQVSGLRPGEKLYEELLIGNNPSATDHPKISRSHEDFISWQNLESDLTYLERALLIDDQNEIRKILLRLVDGYNPEPFINL